MKKIISIIDTIEEKVLVYTFAFSIALIFFQVFMRYVMNNSLSWSEELARYIFIWQGWVGVSFCERFKQHIKIDMVKNLFKGPANKGMEIVSLILGLICAALFVYYGFIFVVQIHSTGSFSPALKVPMWLIYLSLPVSCIFYILRVVLRIYGLITNKEIDEGKAEVSL